MSQQLHLVLYFDTWEFSGVAGAFSTREKAEAACEALNAKVTRSSCRCGKPKGTPGHESCVTNTGYEVDDDPVELDPDV